MLTNIRKVLIIMIGFMAVSLFAEQKIISLAPGYTYQIYKLNRGDALIANTTYCNNPPAAREKVKIGSIVNVNVEKTYALQPDLVISSTLTRRNQIEKLQQLDINVEIFHRPQSLEGILQQYQRLAQLVNREKLASQQLDSLNEIIHSIKSKLENRTGPKILIQIGSDPLYAADQSSFLNDLLKAANCKNVVQTSQSGAFSREDIIARRPQVIIIALNEAKNQIEKERWQKFHSLPAVQNKRIIPVDPDLFCTPTPFNFASSLKKLILLIYPDIKLENE